MQKKVLGALLVMGMVYGAIPMTASAAVGTAADVTKVNPDLLMTAEDAMTWHEVKATFGPHDGGSEGWWQYYNWLKAAFEESGSAVDKLEYTFDYEGFFIDDWKNHEGVLGLTLDPNGAKLEIPVASFTNNSIPLENYSGYTTAPMVYYDSSSYMPPAPGSFAGKIMVVETPPYKGDTLRYVPSDYEFRTGPGPFPRMYEIVDPAVENSYNGRWEWAAEGTLRTWAMTAEAAGMIIISDLPWNMAYGLHERARQFSCPSLFLDRDNGAKVLEYVTANPGKDATIKLIAEYQDLQVSNVIYFLPGVNYGQPNDEFVVIPTHTDSFGLTQENGALGLLGVFKYFEQIPQAERPRTLLFYLDSRHFIYGGEGAHLDQDLFVLYPELIDKGVAQMSMEHMGELEGANRTVDGVYQMVQTGNPVWSWFEAPSNQGIIDALSQAIVDHGLERAEIKCVTRPGVNGGPQMGVGSMSNAFANRAEEIGKPALNLAGNWPGAHTGIFESIEWFDPDLFVTQVAVCSQVIGYFMTASAQELNLVWGQIKDAVRDLGDNAVSSYSKFALLDQCDVIFQEIQAGNFETASEYLSALRWDVVTLVRTEGGQQAPILALIDQGATLLP